MSVAIIILIAVAIIILAFCCFRAARSTEGSTSIYDSMSDDELRNNLEMKLNRRCSR